MRCRRARGLNRILCNLRFVLEIAEIKQIQQTMKKDIFATNNKFWSAKRANHPKKKRTLFTVETDLWYYSYKKVIKQITKIHTLDEEEEEEECMSVCARAWRTCARKCVPKGRWSPEAAKSKNLTTPKAEVIVVVSFWRGREKFNFVHSCCFLF